jgi:hypothetical protein
MEAKSLTDFRSDICVNLSEYRSIVEVPECVEALNKILNELDTLGFGKLVQNFCMQHEPDKAENILFEILVCQMLQRNQDVQALQYEPSEAISPPDFRFRLHGVTFDIQVKQLCNIKNEITRRLFQRECRRHLSRIPKPWLINFRVDDHFTRQHLNPFFTYLKRSIDQFSPMRTFTHFLGEPHYSWESDERTLVQFSFVEKPSKEPGICPGFIYVMATGTGLMSSIDTVAFHKGVQRLLKDSRSSLSQPASSTQANLLVMQAVHPILFAEQTMPDALYGPNSLFRHGKFSNICGLILVSSRVWLFSDHFECVYFLHPSHLHNIQSHPKPFEEMMFHIRPEWRR